MNDVAVTYAQERERYEIRKGGELVGHATARRRDGVVTMPHVEIAPAYRGQNLASHLVRAALDDIESRGERLVALCPFVVAFLRRNPRYQQLKA